MTVNFKLEVLANKYALTLSNRLTAEDRMDHGLYGSPMENAICPVCCSTQDERGEFHCGYYSLVTVVLCILRSM